MDFLASPSPAGIADDFATLLSNTVGPDLPVFVEYVFDEDAECEILSVSSALTGARAPFRDLSRAQLSQLTSEAREYANDLARDRDLRQRGGG